MNMIKILEGVKVDHLLSELNEHDELWDRYTFRTAYETSAHKDVHDIVLRYRAYDEYDPEHPQDFAKEHTSEWYAAAHHMPCIKKVVEDIFTLVGGDELGGCLITKIPAGKSVLPHSDAGHWHSENYNAKFLLLLQSAPLQTFEFGEEVHTGESGELFIFDNMPVHAVYNRSDIDRISLIMAVRKN